MANFNAVNKAVKSARPELKIEVVRGQGYVYFDGDDGFDKVESIMVHPVATSTESLIRIVLSEIESVYPSKAAEVVEVESEDLHKVTTEVETIEVLTRNGIVHHVEATYDHAWHKFSAKLVKVHCEQECWLAVVFHDGVYRGFTTWGDRQKAIESVSRAIGSGCEEVRRQITK